jgi:putative spermidine/putrescine transport system ATP-binding protein
LSLSDRIVVMHEGRADRIGTPAEIYNTPSTAFVASFVGTLNRLEAQVQQPAQGKLRLDGQDIYTTVPLAPGLAGQTVLLGVRPENLSMNHVPTNGQHPANHLTGQVENVAFLGSIVRIQLRLQRHALFFDAFNQPQANLPRIGEQVTVSFPREACLILQTPAAPAN